MSFRRPKAKVINNESSDEEQQTTMDKKSSVKIQKKGRIKPKVKMNVQQLEEQNDHFDDLPIQRTKRERVKNSLKLPNFDTFDDEHGKDKDITGSEEGLTNNPFDHYVDVNSNQNIIHKHMPRTDTQEERAGEILNQDDLKDLTQSDEFEQLNNFVSVESPHENLSKDISIEDGYPPDFTTIKANKTEEDRNDEKHNSSGESDYLSDLTSDNEEWVSSKLKSGSIMNKPKVRRTILPKLNLLSDVSLDDESKRLKQMIEGLKMRKIDISQQLEDIEAKKAKNDDLKIDWERKLIDLADSLGSHTTN